MKTLFSFLFICLFSVSMLAESKTYGKVLTADEADALFGNVIESVSVDKDLFLSYMDQCDNYMMFTIRDGQLIIADDNRRVLTPYSVEVAANSNSVPDSYFLSEDEVMHVYSKSVIEELIQKGSGNEFVVEQRSEVISVNHGDFVMEFSLPCPPFCP